MATGIDVGFAITNGSLVAWGASAAVQVPVPTGAFSAVAMGNAHGVAVRTNGKLASWGNNDSGQVSNTPGGKYVVVAAGENFSVAIRANGTLAQGGMTFSDR